MERIWRANSCILPGLHKNERGRHRRASLHLRETTIISLATRTAALAAGVLLCCAPLHAQQAAPGRTHTHGKHQKHYKQNQQTQQTRQNQRECSRLRAAIQDSEQSERRVRAALMESVQQDLLILRKRYRVLGCAATARS